MRRSGRRTGGRRARSSDVRSGAAIVERLLEWRHAEAPIGGQEVFFGTRPLLHIGVDDRLHSLDDRLRAEARPDDLADRGVLVARTAERDLIGLFAGALEAENADMADMVMAAGVDAAGDLDLERPDRAGARAIAEALGKALRDRDRAGRRQRAIIEARAGDDVADEPGVGRR